MKCCAHVFAGRAAHGKFHDQQRESKGDKEQNIDDDEKSAAVFTGNIGESPDVAQTDGTAGGKKKESDSAPELFSGHGLLTH